MKKELIIPVIHCFDDNYSMPAAVAFLSMLEHADCKYFYKLYVLHNDITEKHQNMLNSIVSRFENATLEFIDMENKFEDLFHKLKAKGHYSKEMFYKFLPEHLFSEYEKIIISDVDVVYQGDISKEFIHFNIDEDYYLAAHKCSIIKHTWVEKFYNSYDENFTPEEKEKIYTSAVFWIFNLKKMRADKMSEKFINFALLQKGELSFCEDIKLILKGFEKSIPSDFIKKYMNSFFEFSTQEDYEHLKNVFWYYSPDNKSCVSFFEILKNKYNVSKKSKFDFIKKFLGKKYEN